MVQYDNYKDICAFLSAHTVLSLEIIEQLLDTVIELDKKDRNHEDAHIIADELLIMALRRISLDEDVEFIVRRIINKYISIPKWYA